MNDIEKTIEQLSRDVGRFNTNNNTVVQNIKSSIQNPFKLNLISICVFIFFSIIIFLYFAKPNFIMMEIKDEKTFFIESKINYKYIAIIAIILTIISAYLLNMLNKKFNLFS